MSCVLETLSLHELNIRKEYLLKQIDKINNEIQKRNNPIEDLLNNDISLKNNNSAIKIKINIAKKKDVELSDITQPQTNQNKTIKIKITKTNNGVGNL